MARVCTLIINPVSGGHSRERIAKVRETLEAEGIATELMITERPEDASSFARRVSLEREAPFIAAGGGDGTVNGVVNGMEPGRGTLAVIPLGTANVLARELGIGSVEEAAARIIRGETRPLTVGVLEKGGEERRFILMAGIGLDGSIVAGVRLNEKRLLGKGAYLLAAARLMGRWQRGGFEAKADGRNVRCHSLLVCNSARYGGGFVVAPGADIFSPLFRVVCITAETRLAYWRIVLSVLCGRVADNPDMELLSTGELEVAGERAVQLDGDYVCRAPVRVRAMAGFTRLIV